jgi:hypothetical protein
MQCDKNPIFKQVNLFLSKSLKILSCSLFYIRMQVRKTFYTQFNNIIFSVKRASTFIKYWIYVSLPEIWKTGIQN